MLYSHTSRSFFARKQKRLSRALRVRGPFARCTQGGSSTRLCVYFIVLVRDRKNTERCLYNGVGRRATCGSGIRVTAQTATAVACNGKRKDGTARGTVRRPNTTKIADSPRELKAYLCNVPRATCIYVLSPSASRSTARALRPDSSSSVAAEDRVRHELRVR